MRMRSRPAHLITGTKESALYHLEKRGGRIVWSTKRLLIARTLRTMKATRGVDAKGLPEISQATGIPLARLRRYLGANTEFRLAGIVATGAKQVTGEYTYWLTEKGGKELQEAERGKKQ